MTESAHTIVELIKIDHQTLLEHANAMCEAKDGATAKSFYARLKVALTAHSDAEAFVVYRALDRLNVQALSEATKEGEVEHSLCDHLVQLMNRGKPDSALWRARAQVVLELLEHHIDEEHKDMLPELKARYDDQAQRAMAVRFLERKASTKAA